MNMDSAARAIELSAISILVVDDEASIRKTLEGVFADEGYDTLHASDGETALALIAKENPSLVLLDIWMPGMDGIETLQKIKESYPDLPVVMMSGHATISTAVGATRLGAADFIEKPLDLYSTLHTVRRALKVERASQSSSSASKQSRVDPGLFEGATWNIRHLDTRAMSEQTMRGKKRKQRTLAGSAILYGQGLHSGRKSGLIFEPLPPGSGIQFVGVSEASPVPAHVDFVESTGFATTLRLGSTQAGTIEHVMSALHAYGISNLLIKCNGEVPVMDGSALDFCNLIEATGLEDQDGDWYEIKIEKPIRVDSGKEWVEFLPGDGFEVEYTAVFPNPIGEQRIVFSLNDVADYKREIAPARTFGFVKDIDMLQKMGLALGGRFDNFVLLGESGPINGKLRFADEMVRHKVLDAIGDLYLLGRPIRGKVRAHMTGHSDNFNLLRMLREELKTAK